MKKANCKLNLSFWFSIFAIAFSTITIGLFFWKVAPCSDGDALTFIGVIAAFIGLSVTLVIGFQIFSTISMKDKLKEMDLLKDELMNTNKELLSTKYNLYMLESELKGTISYSEGMIYYGQNKYSEAFEKIQSAITYYSNLDSQKEILDAYVGLLSVCADKISEEEFDSKNKKLMIDVLLTSIQNCNFKLKETKYYFVIKKDYENVYNRFVAKVISYKK